MDGGKEIKEVKDRDSIDQVVILADEIWREHYIPIIGVDQVDYMLNKYQSASAIRDQIKDGAFYFLVYYRDKPAGYFSFYHQEDSLFLSKIYIHSSLRGTGLGRFSIEFIEKEAQRFGQSSITLTVNKNNAHTIAAYKKMGFEVEEAIVMDIGNGFVMDDYKMKKYLA